MEFVLTSVAQAAPYIRDESVGAGGLAQLVGALELDAGQVQAYVPEDAPDQAIKFATGSFSNAVEVEAVRALVEHLVEARGLPRDPAKVLICEFADAPAARPPSLRSDSKYPAVWLEDAPRDAENGELWFAVAGAEPRMIEAMLRELLWFPAFGVLTSQTSVARLEDGHTVRYQVLREFVSRAEMVICGAWDASNYLLWTPTTSSAAHDGVSAPVHGTSSPINGGDESAGSRRHRTSLRRDLREAGASGAEIDEFVANGDWGLQVSVKQYAELSDGGRVLDPVYLGVELWRHSELDEAERADRLRIDLETAFREEMLEPDDWDTLMDALRKLGIEITYDELLSLPLTVRLATPEDGPVPLPEF